MATKHCDVTPDRSAAPGRPNATQILLVDPHPAVLEGLTLLIERDQDIEVSATAPNAASARRIIDHLPLDIAIVARELPDGDGVHLCDEIARRMPNVQCVVHSAGEIVPQDLAHHSVTAFVLKQLSGTDLMDTIQDLSKRVTPPHPIVVLPVQPKD